MKDVFLSRPTWVDQKYKQGLDGFIRFLEIQNCKPRTLGTTDYATISPLDEVISLMKKCSGAIVLGYPQIVVESGLIKNESIQKPISLGTEWNHIEATLAYTLNIPLLIIHDRTVSRGIFERGTLNSFLYATDFENSTWFAGEEITGALTAWVNRLSN